jgi:hypothetical protein
MARPKSLIKTLSIDTAQKSHFCKHDGKHSIKKGDKRLKLKVGRTYEHFCGVCAKSFIQKDISKLDALLHELKNSAKED